MKGNSMAQDALFDPDQFMQSTIDAPMETDYQLAPEGTFVATVGDFDSKAFQKFDFVYKKGPKEGQEGSMTKFSCPFVTQDPAVLAAMEGRESVTLEAQLTLDRTANGSLDFGKDRNVKLGRLRKALGQNNPGPWSPSDLRGKGPLLIQVKHEKYTPKDGGEPRTFARVVDFAPMK
jgi:hypothetical protein